MSGLRVAPEEAVRLVSLARITASLILFSLAACACSVVTLLVWPVTGNRNGLLISTASLSGSVFLLACMLFLSRGGAAAHAIYMRVMSFILYVSSMVTCYLIGLLIYSLATRAKPAPTSRPALIGLVVGLSIAGLGCIIATLRFPRLLGFVREFQNYPRSRKVNLIDFLISAPGNPESGILVKASV